MTVLCVDFGSTFTKVGWVDADQAELRATVAVPTTLESDVLDGLATCCDLLRRQGCRVDGAEVLASSSAGGGLRIAVIGNERLVTSEAGSRVSLSSGGHVVEVISGGLDASGVGRLAAATPDLLLLVGGTDGGNAETLLRSAQTIAAAHLQLPVVVAGNAAAAAEVSELLSSVEHLIAANVVPEIGVFAPDDARRRVRQLFLTHVIGGKHLSRSAEFAQMVRGATPDVVLRGVETIAANGVAVAVVDVGGATTDVHSVLQVDAAEGAPEAGLSREVVAPSRASRTVEGDLGVRWSAPATLSHGQAEGLLTAADRTLLDMWVSTLSPSRLPHTAAERAADAVLATIAVAGALRRHSGRSEALLIAGRRVLHRSGVDLREVELLIGSGGVLRADPTAGVRLVSDALARAQGTGRMLPERPRVAVDGDYLLSPIGLLAEQNPAVAAALAASFGT